MTRDVITTEMAKAQAAVKSWEVKLSGRQVTGKDTRNNPTYRHLQSEVRQWRNRFVALDKMVAINLETATRKAENAAAPKVKAEKVKPVKAAPKAPKAPKEKGKGA